MKLQGTINKHDLVKYLAREYAYCKKMERRLKGHDMEKVYRNRAGTYCVVIWNLRDNTIWETP